MIYEKADECLADGMITLLNIVDYIKSLFNRKVAEVCLRENSKTIVKRLDQPIYANESNRESKDDY